ncbi:RNA pyrophosphohydrolase [bacterium]|jgi:8-oxo-dGTP diphosphatase|nr:RNA pyrophosphohydrolase [bacterium]|tara:strand:- start:437 stop:865 length:429 start_codon:yes stop_codon:yes gene_type:complete
MQKGFDYIGVCVCFYCHDGKGNYVFHKRGEACRDESGVWDGGGGGVKHGESIEEAVKREVLEEYGTDPLEIEELGYSDVFRDFDGKKSHWVAFRFKVLVDREQVINNEPHKHEELGWFRIDSLPTPLHSQIPGELERFKDKL